MPASLPTRSSSSTTQRLGNDLLEDGLYVMEDRLADPKFKDDMVKFVRASMKGWDYALENPDEAAQIVVDADDSRRRHLKHERYMVSAESPS